MYLEIPLLIGLTVALIFLGRLYFRQDVLVFRPGPTLDRSPASAALPYRDVRLSCADGSHVRGWWIPNAASQQAVIFFHGSDGNITHEVPVVQFLHFLPANALLVEYPGYDLDGVRPSEQSCYQAAEAAWAYVADVQRIPANKVILFGQSLGSAVATYLAAGKPCGGLVIQSGFTSVPDLAALAYPYLPVGLFCHTRMHSLERIARCGCPVLVLHSEDDEAIPVAQARRLYANVRSQKRFVGHHGPHHGHPWMRDPSVRAAWLQLLNGEIRTWEGPGKG